MFSEMNESEKLCNRVRTEFGSLANEDQLLTPDMQFEFGSLANEDS